MDLETATRKFHAFIHARSLAVIATTGPDGKPEAALINIAVTPELEIIFETTDARANSPTSRRIPGSPSSSAGMATKLSNMTGWPNGWRGGR